MLVQAVLAAENSDARSNSEWAYDIDPHIPSAWGAEWRNILRRAEVRSRPPFQVRHTYACWNLAAGGNLAFIAAQMGHADYLTFMKTYGRWIHSESSSEQQRIWEAQQNLGRFGTNFVPRNRGRKRNLLIYMEKIDVSAHTPIVETERCAERRIFHFSI